MTSDEAKTERRDRDEPGTARAASALFPPAPALPPGLLPLAHEVAARLVERRRARWAPRPGEVLGDLRLEELIGRGGMGEVWRAREPSGAPVAIKLLGADRADDPRAEARLAREHEALERLDHPTIVRASASGRAPDGRPWFAMELVPGASTLAAALRDGLGLERALDALEHVADAVGHAHRVGVLHRDLKPGNILLDAEGRTRLVDFGIVRVPGGARLTSTGDVWGTPGFVAPEQIERPDEVKPWTDVFGLGATLHQVLAGSPPGVGHALVPIVTLPPDAPPALADLCRRALSYACARRPRDGHAFLAQLRAARMRPASPARWRARSFGLAGVGAALVWLVAVVPGVGGRPGPPLPSSPPSTATLPPLHAEPAVRVEVSQGELPEPLPPGLVAGTRTNEVVNLKDGSLLVWIPGGVLSMGAAQGNANEAPVHDVHVAGFFMGKFELDWSRFRAFCADTGREAPSARIEGPVPFHASEEHPVFNVRLADALAYCEWAGLRLPSEAEWEWAAKGDDPRRIYPWGPALPLDGTRVANIADRTAQRLAPEGFGLCTPEYDDGAFWPTPVGTYPAGASWAGCLDLSGNVWEWTSDRWRFYPDRPAPGDPVQAVRGGSWDNPVRFVQCTHRGASPPSTRAAYLGFRVAHDAR